MDLYYRKFGKGGPVLILHGLFGSSDNWMGIGKMLADHYTVFIPDQRNHGNSPHSETWNYEVMAGDVKALAEKEGLSEFCVLGHSMGGKVAMKLAEKYPSLLNRIMILDIGPKAYPIRHQFIIDGLKSIEVDKIKTRKEADRQLAKHISSTPVRQFLLKNLERSKDHSFQWKINLPVIDRDIAEVGKAQKPAYPVEKETLFVRGEKSDYILDSDWDEILRLFPKAALKTISKAGHWMHAEQPQAVMDAVKNFFNC